MDPTSNQPPGPRGTAAAASPARGDCRLTGCLKLLAACALLAVVWLRVLPWAARQPALREAIDRNEALGIDPSATYYTEIDAMDTILQRMQSLHRSRSRVLWQVRPTTASRPSPAD